MGIYLWPNSWFYAASTNHDQVMNYMKDWIRDRSVWLDNNIPGVAQDCELYEPPYANLVTGIEENEVVFNIYPNPVKEVLTIRSRQQLTEIVIYNLLGQPVYRKSLNTNSIKLDLGNLRQGMYLLNIRTNRASKIRRIRIE